MLVQDDPELSYNTQIFFEVDDSGLGEEEAFEAMTQWNRQIGQHCPATHTHVFCMLLAPLP